MKKSSRTIRFVLPWFLGLNGLVSFSQAHAQPLPDINIYLGLRHQGPVTAEILQAAIDGAQSTENQRVIIRIMPQREPIVLGSFDKPGGIQIRNKTNLIIKVQALDGSKSEPIELRTMYLDNALRRQLTCGDTLNSRTNGFDVIHSNRIRIENFKITQSSRGKCTGVSIKGSKDVVIDGIIHSHGSSMVEIEGDEPIEGVDSSSQITVQNSYSSAASYGIYLTSGSHIVLQRNHIEWSQSDCIKMGAIGDVSNVSILENLLTRCKQDGVDLALVDTETRFPNLRPHLGSLTGLTIERNVMAHNLLMGIQLKLAYIPTGAHARRGFSKVIIRNNLLIGNRAKGLVVLSARDPLDRAENGCFIRKWKVPSETTTLIQGNILIQNAAEKYMTDGCPSSIHVAGSCGVRILGNTVLGAQPEFPEVCLAGGPTTVPYRTGDVLVANNWFNSKKLRSDLRDSQRLTLSDNQSISRKILSAEINRLQDMIKNPQVSARFATFFDQIKPYDNESIETLETSW